MDRVNLVREKVEKVSDTSYPDARHAKKALTAAERLEAGRLVRKVEYEGNENRHLQSYMS